MRETQNWLIVILDLSSIWLKYGSFKIFGLLGIFESSCVILSSEKDFTSDFTKFLKLLTTLSIWRPSRVFPYTIASIIS